MLGNTLKSTLMLQSFKHKGLEKFYLFGIIKGIQTNHAKKLRMQLLDVAASTLHRVLKGYSGISPEIALRLSKTLGRSPESWLAMQDNYDLRQAKKNTKLSDAHKINLNAA